MNNVQFLRLCSQTTEKIREKGMGVKDSLRGLAYPSTRFRSKLQGNIKPKWMRLITMKSIPITSSTSPGRIRHSTIKEAMRRKFVLRTKTRFIVIKPIPPRELMQVVSSSEVSYKEMSKEILILNYIQTFKNRLLLFQLLHNRVMAMKSQALLPQVPRSYKK